MEEGGEQKWKGGGRGGGGRGKEAERRRAGREKTKKPGGRRLRDGGKAGHSNRLSAARHAALAKLAPSSGALTSSPSALQSRDYLLVSHWNGHLRLLMVADGQQVPGTNYLKQPTGFRSMCFMNTMPGTFITVSDRSGAPSPPVLRPVGGEGDGDG